MKKTLARLTAASAIAVLALSVPLSSSLHLSGAALAKSGGEHGGGGNSGGGNGGGGNGGGHSGESGGKSGEHSSGHSSGSDKSSHGSKSSHAGEDEQETDDDNDDSGTKSSKGPLGAAHASANARAHASPNSAVGRIAAYERDREEAMAIADDAEREAALTQAEADLEEAFGRNLTEAQIAEINALLDRD